MKGVMLMLRNKNYESLKLPCLIGAIVLLIASIIGITVVYQKRIALVREVTRSEMRLKTSKTKYHEKAKEVTQEAQKEAATSKNPAINTVVKQIYYSNQITKTANKFFNIYYTWSDYDDYMKRAKKASKIITNNLAKNKEIFDNGKDTTGGNIIQNEQLHSEFESAKAYLSQSHGSTARALVKVTNSAWYSDGKANAGDSTHYYDLVYNLNTNKISNLKLVFTESSDGND